jgi:hypothetical protein
MPPKSIDEDNRCSGVEARMLLLYFVFAFVERKNEIQIKKYLAAAGEKLLTRATA